VAMSLLALVLCVIAKLGIASDPPGDEGALAHSYQLLMVVQLPLILCLVYLAIRAGLRQQLPRLGLQLGLWLCALGAVALFRL